VNARQRLGRVVVDISPLRDFPAYRRLWLGQSVNIIGSQVTRVALPYQVYVLTHSTLAIAGLTLVQLVPLLLFSLGGGSLADVVDRRRLLLVTQAALALSSLALAIVSLGTPDLVVLFAIAFVASAFGSIDQPTRASSTPRLVPAHRLPAAIALGQLSYNAGSVIGPAVGGLILAGAGVSGAYTLDVVTYGVSIVAIMGLPSIPPVVAGRRAGLAAIRESLAFVRSRRTILSTFAIDLNAMIFGMPTALFPALALDVFRAGPVGVGLLNAAPAAGAFVAVFLSGIVTRLRRIGRGIIVAVVVWGASIALFGLSTFSFPLALFFLGIAGAADVLSAVLRSTLVQLTTPDDLRGRVSAIHILVVTSGPRIGDVEAGTAAALGGVRFSVVSGGLACIAGVALVLVAFPALLRYDAQQALPEESDSSGAAAGRLERSASS
jgi:MFS family permease